jgi:hydrogenase 3 maturation protease
VGNELRGDDGFGPLLAARLAERGAPAIDAGSAPEMQSSRIRRFAPDLLLIADAADLGLPPGSLRLLAEDEIQAGATGTHDPSLRMLLDFLRADLVFETRVLAVQPSSVAFGAPLSAAVAAAIERSMRCLES